MSTRYVLVADASRARLFHERSPGAYELVGTFEHADSRAHVRDIVSDATGRKPAGTPVGGNYGGRSVSLGVGRPGVAPDTDPKEVEAEKFARELAGVLEAQLHNRDATLVLAAPPHFLGLLKQTVSTTVTKRIEHTVDKDFTNLEARELPARMRSELAPSGP